MSFTTEINVAIQSGLRKFIEFINEKTHEDANYLTRSFWVAKGEQVTILNYLIQQHQETKSTVNEVASSLDLTQFIDFILSNAPDKNLGEPLHQALALGKIQLTRHLLKKEGFDMNRRDEEGRTLLSLAVETKNQRLLEKIVRRNAQVNATTRLTAARVPFQPLHQAIALDFASGVTCLAAAGADLTNPVGMMKDTPVLLAARQGKIKALEALLEFPVEKLDLDAEQIKGSSNKAKGDNAIELLCQLLVGDKNNKSLLRGVAMLLCRGAEPPRKGFLCQILADKRGDLLKEIDSYLDRRPELVDPFVNRCHLSDNALHKIIYVDHSWGSTLRQLFGRPSDAAFVIERLVTRKYSRPQDRSHQPPDLSPVAAVSLKGNEPSWKLYAEFVRRYKEAYQHQRVTNPWSTMRWMIAEGNCNWELVQEYARTHPGSRTQIIYEDMFKTFPKMDLHKPIDSTPDTLHQ